MTVIIAILITVGILLSVSVNANTAIDIAEEPAIQTSDAQVDVYRQTAFANPSPDNVNIPPTEEVLMATPPLGIIEDPSVSFPGGLVKVENIWQNYINGELITVFAMWNRDKPEQGYLYIQSNSSNSSVPTGYFYSPFPSGAIKIISSDSNILTVSSLDGNTFIFNVTTGQFNGYLPDPYPLPQRTVTSTTTVQPIETAITLP